MGTMVRINAHLAGHQDQDEDEDEKLVFIVLVANRTKKIVPGTYFGEVIEFEDNNNEYTPYPIRYYCKSSGESRLGFGGYSYEEGSTVEYFYTTNLQEKEIIAGQYFSVTSRDGDESTEYTYVIDQVVDMNALSIPGDF